MAFIEISVNFIGDNKLKEALKGSFCLENKVRKVKNATRRQGYVHHITPSSTDVYQEPRFWQKRQNWVYLVSHSSIDGY